MFLVLQKYGSVLWSWCFETFKFKILIDQFSNNFYSLYKLLLSSKIKQVVKITRNYFTHTIQ